MNVRRLVVAMVGAPLAAALVLMACVSPARAAGPPDISGTWKCCGAGGAGPQTWIITDSSGKLSGHGGGGRITFPIGGRIAGNSARIFTGPYKQLPSYNATFRGTVSANDSVIKGTWSSDEDQSGTFTATRSGAAPAAAATGSSTITSSLPIPLGAFGSAGAMMATAVVAAGALLFLAFAFNLASEGNYGDIAASWVRQRRRMPGLAPL